MAKFEVIMPKMGESIEEATITKWFVSEGDKVVEDDVLLEIATDKVDSEIPSPVEGVVKKILFSQDDIVAVGTVIAVIDLDGDADSSEESTEEKETDAITEVPRQEGSKTQGEASEEGKADEKATLSENEGKAMSASEIPASADSGRFYSPLVRKIASEEGVSAEELATITGSGLNDRVQKNDILRYIEQRKSKTSQGPADALKTEDKKSGQKSVQRPEVTVKSAEGDEIIEMSRMRKLIAAHMINSKQTSAHVTNMLEIDVTNVVNWRNKIKNDFQAREGQKLTYMPIFMEATIKALRDFPMINSSLDEDRIIVRKDINLGIAVALEDNNLIVPNIKKADQLNLTGLTGSLNRLAANARNNKLSPDDINGGTFTITNFGTFKNDIGTPIINQPEVAILAIGSIKKKPAVLETEDGDVIAIRQKMWISLTYDHRIIDGALGGSFLRKLGDYIESFDINRSI